MSLQQMKTFPHLDWSQTLPCSPGFLITFVWKVMIEDVEIKKQLLTEKPLVKGYNLFKPGHVLQMLAKQRDQMFSVLSKVLPSVKKGKVYNVKIVLTKDGIVYRASCACPAGVDG